MNNKRVLKFGGSSIKTPLAMKRCVSLTLGTNNVSIVIVSAIGKTTNKIEQCFTAAINNENYIFLAKELLEFHILFAKELNIKATNLFDKVFKEFVSLLKKVASNSNINKKKELDFAYKFGELCSSIIFYNLISLNYKNTKLIYAKDYIKTDGHYGLANPNCSLIEERCSKLSNDILYISQGFIASDLECNATTLGREGSDYSATLFAYGINSKEVIIYTDVSGIANKDPNLYKKITYIKKMNYEFASFMAESGAKVLFKRTMDPLKVKNIPLIVKSSMSESLDYTKISDTNELVKEKILISKLYDTYSKITLINYESIPEELLGKPYEEFEFLGYNVKVIKI